MADVVPASPRSRESITAGAAREDLEFDPRELSGSDAKVAELAAHRLLQAIATKEPSLEAKKAAHLSFLLDALSSARLGRTAASLPPDYLAAQRIVDALATWTTSSGPPFPRASEVLLPLLGVGPANFREAVIRAVKALASHELKAGRRSPAPGGASGSRPGAGRTDEREASILTTLAARLGESSPPPEAFFRDATVVLWELDGKLLLGTFMGILSAPGILSPGGSAPSVAGMALEELRSRVPLDFATLDGWHKWWGEVRDLPLERILADGERRSREGSVAVWRQILRRLRETGDAERLCLALKDTLEGGQAVELRAAAVAGLGDLPEWIAEMRVPESPTGDKPQESPKDRVLTRGVQLLVQVFDRGAARMERPEILRAAMAGLRKYHAFLERSPALLGAVARIVVERMEALSAAGAQSDRGDLLETLRLAGALRVRESLGFIEGILDDANGRIQEDLELVTAAIMASGRLHEVGFSAEAASLLMSHFRRPWPGPEKAVRDLRRACVTALSSGSDDPEVRAGLRAFLGGILQNREGHSLPPGERELQIPAILGLGTLARQKDAPALDVLIEILSRQDQFEPQEVIAAIDSIAYVGGSTAIASFVRCLVAQTDKVVSDHLWKKVVSLIETGGSSALALTFETLEALSLEEDMASGLDRAAALMAEPQVKGLLAPEKLDVGAESKFRPYVRASLSLARIKDLLGDEDGAQAVLGTVSDLLQKNPAQKDRLADDVGAITAFRKVLAERTALAAKLEKADGSDPVALLKGCEGLLLADTTLSGRHRNLRWVLRRLAPGPDSEPLSRLRALWHEALSAEGRSDAWEGFPPGFRQRYLGRLAGLGGER